MLDDTVSEVFNFLDFEDIDVGQPFKNFAFGPNFSGIGDKEFHGKISFVDGGNLELVGAPNFTIHLMRIYFNIFQNNKKQVSVNNFFEYLCLVKATDNKTYKAKLIPLTKNAETLLIEDLEFDAFDSTLMSEGKRASPSLIPQKIRRLMEWKLVSEVIKNQLNAGDFIVMDGTLQTSFSNETKFSKLAQDAAIEKNVFLTSLAKTSTLLTTTGFPLLSAVKMLGKDRQDSWYYYPVIKTSSPDSEIYIVKLNSKSNYVFKFETFFKQEPELDKLFACLKSNSVDSTFLGYPYGLIDADNNAKIFQNEKNSYLSFLFPKLSKLRKFILSSDAHELLNLVY